MVFQEYSDRCWSFLMESSQPIAASSIAICESLLDPGKPHICFRGHPEQALADIIL